MEHSSVFHLAEPSMMRYRNNRVNLSAKGKGRQREDEPKANFRKKSLNLTYYRFDPTCREQHFDVAEPKNLRHFAKHINIV